MKNLTAIAFLFFVLTFVSSCQKETLPNTGGQNVVAVEYRITSVSENIGITYLYPENGVLVEKTESCMCADKSISFNWYRGQQLMVSAYNSRISNDLVTVQIYVNNVLLAEGKTNNPHAPAKAEGKP